MHAHDGLPQPQRLLAFSSIALTLFLAVLDGAVANIALPPIARELNIRAVDAIWVVNAYQLAVTMVILPLASLGESVGYKRIYLGGIALFTFASLLCGLSSTLPMLIAARAVQGLGAAGIMSLNLAMIRFITPRAQMGRAAGNTAVVVAVSSAIGPTLAGLLLTVMPWQGLFLINVPLGLVALLVGWRVLPNAPVSGRRFDIRSAILSAATFGLVISGVNGLGHDGNVLASLSAIAAGLAVGAVLVWTTLDLPAPMLPVDLLRHPIFALSATTSVLSFAAQAIAFVSLPFFIHDTLGHSPSATGLMMTPWPLATAVSAFIAGRLADQLQPGKIAAAGLVLFALGLVALALVPAGVSDLDLLWRLALAGFGFGVFQAPNNRVYISSAPRERSGGASAIQSGSRLVGQTLGVAVLATVFGLLPQQAVPASLWLAAALAAAGVLPSALRRFET